MAYWNYRVFEKKDPLGNIYYQIHEVHYHDGPKSEKNDLYPKAYSAEATAPYGDTPEELKDAIQKSLEALNKPVINQQKLDEYFKNKTKKGLTPFS